MADRAFGRGVAGRAGPARAAHRRAFGHARVDVPVRPPLGHRRADLWSVMPLPRTVAWLCAGPRILCRLWDHRSTDLRGHIRHAARTGAGAHTAQWTVRVPPGYRHLRRRGDGQGARPRRGPRCGPRGRFQLYERPFRRDLRGPDECVHVVRLRGRGSDRGVGDTPRRRGALEKHPGARRDPGGRFHHERDLVPLSQR